MIGLLIKNAKMPKGCNVCPFRTTFACHCFNDPEGNFMDVSCYKDERHPDCPLMKVSTYPLVEDGE